MPLSSHPAGNRALIERFGAHVAHLLNAGDGAAVEVKPFALYLRVIALLSGKGRKGPEYRDGLLGFWLPGADRTAEQLAQVYLDGVLERRLMLARGNEQHIAHELFALLCHRGVADGWEASQLARAKSLPAVPAAMAPAPLDFESVAVRLAKIDKGLSRGNPAKATAEAKGPLLLLAGQGQAEVADELSAWKAIITSPVRQRQLVEGEGEAFHELWSLVIKAFETANVHYGTLLRLGLPPFDWADTLSINTARAVSRFLTACGEVSTDQRDAVETWR
jgi:hypothetical protein